MINAKIGYMSDAQWAALDYATFCANWAGAPVEKPSSGYYLPGSQRLHYDEVNALLVAGVKLELEPLPGAMLTKMQRQNWDRYHEMQPDDLAQARVVQISVPDQALMLIDEVTNLDDCCTDNLQEHLDDGWRILAVCPPNAQRRPDYILGRRKKTDPFTR